MRLIFCLTLLVGLAACHPVEQATVSAMGQILAPDNRQNLAQFAKVLPQTRLSFPVDHQAHNNFRQEWWYLTANLKTVDGTPFGLQWTQFRVALAPDIEKARFDLLPVEQTGWVTKQLYMAHSAVTGDEFHYAAERWSRAHPQLAGVQNNPLKIYLNDWHWEAQGKDFFPARLKGHDDKFSYSLSLKSNAPYQLQGIEGFSIKSADGLVASHYYSQPFINIEGEISVAGKTMLVSGEGWLDREWSSQFLTKDQQGWDWFALRLNKDTALMLFQLRGGGEKHKDLDNKPSHFYAGRLMYRNGQGVSLSAGQISIHPKTTTLISGKKIPTSWQIHIPDLNIDLTVEALNTAALMPLTIEYWEGPVSISGSHQGVGYMELTGY